MSVVSKISDFDFMLLVHMGL